MSSTRDNQLIRYLTSLVIVWLVGLLVLGFLQLIGAPYGFKVWPLEEDRVWLDIIQNSKNISIVHGFWAINDRNPLSAWWWTVISPFVLFSDYAMYLVRKCMDPILAILTFLLIDQLGRKNCRNFAFSVALIVLLWNFSKYFAAILWLMLGALALTLLTLLFYCRYVDSNRSKGDNLALALICYFITISTYTIQSGAIIGVAALAAFRKPSHGSVLLADRIKNTLRDTSYFIAIFIIYNCIWYTVNRNSETFYVFQLSLFLKQIGYSFLQFLYHPFYSNFFIKIWRVWPKIAIVLTWLTAFFTLYFLLSKKIKQINDTNMPVGWTIVLLGSIAFPTLLLESLSTIWKPGTRSIMVQQVWQPLLYVSVIFIITNFFFKNFRNKKTLTFVMVALLGATVVLVDLDYNRRLVLRTAYQRNLVHQIQKLNISYALQPAFIVKMKSNDDDLNSLSPLITMFTQTVLKTNNLTIRPLAWEIHDENVKYWRVILNEDNIGAGNARALGDERMTPYTNLWIVFFDGKKITMPEQVNAKDFDGLQVVWNRQGAIDQRLNHPGFDLFTSSVQSN